MILILIAVSSCSPVQEGKVIHSSEVDSFGVGEIYPTKHGGRESYVNIENPKDDP